MSRSKLQPSSKTMVPVYVGLDYHENTIRVCVMDLEGRTLVNRNVVNQPKAVFDLVSALGSTVRGVAIEACCGAADFAAELIELTEWPVRMAHAGAVSKLKKTRDKTDTSDAEVLADLIRVGYLPEVWLADEQTRQLRRLVRHRYGVVERRKAAKLRVLSLLREERTHHPSGVRPWTDKWMHWVKLVPLGEASRWVMDQELEVIRIAEQDLKNVEEKMKVITQNDAVVAKLQQKAGVGLVTAVVMRAVIGRFDRFRNGKQLSNYSGITPRNASSGKRQADAGLIQSGNEILRMVLIQLAKRLPRQDQYWKEFRAKMSVSKPANVVSAAIANRWLRRLHHEMVEQPSMVEAG